MLEGLLGGLVSPEAKAKAINNVIEDALEENAQKLGVKYSDLFIMIKPKSDDFDFDLVLYRTDEGQPKIVRFIKIQELI